jgi:hypothetical protein
MFAKHEVKEEVCLANDPHPQVLIVGDSHAVALNSAAYLNSVPLKTLLVAGLACPPYPNIEFLPRSASNYGHNCREVANDGLKMAQALPSITTVVVATHFADLGRFSYKDSGGGMLSEKQAFLRGNTYLIDRLLAMKKHVVFVIDVPRLKIQPVNCVPRLFKPDPPSCNLPVSDALDPQREYRDWVAELSRAIPALSLYDSFRALCDSGTCLARDNQHFFYQDYDHLSVLGSEKVLADMRQYLDL